MAARKRKSPDRRKPAAAPGLPLRALLAAGTILGRNPKPVLGIAAFGVLFSFVAANALWYQPEGHPAPFWATRDPNDPNAMPGFRRIHHGVPADVTTFRIERASDSNQPAGSGTQLPSQAAQNQQAQNQQAQNQPASNQQLAGQPAPVHASGPYAPIQPVPAGDPVYAAGSHELVAAVQAELARRGLYDGANDGLAGSRTSKAILAYQQKMGFDSTGEATPELLAALQAQARANGLPALVSSAQQAQQAAPVDPVAQAIADASGQPSSPVQAQPQKNQGNAIALPTPRPAPADLGAGARAQNGQPQNGQRATVQPATLPLRQAMPAARPRENVALRSDDPVAAAIRAQSRNPGMTPPADIPVGSVRPTAARQSVSAPPLHTAAATRVSAAGSAPDLVLQIQRGLSNIAYADVRVSGYADRDTKDAIRRFERHYRLPETGEPNPMVLQKLKAIGAL
jgi:hypothetical protein